jgi:UDP-glucose 4-epimerase
MILDDKTVLITGGTGSIGTVLVRRLLRGELGAPRRVIVFSRDEAKQHSMRLAFQQLRASTEEIIFRDFERMLQFRIGDVRDLHSISTALRQADIVLNAAALKQVPSCEYFPFEAVQTNIIGAENIVRAIREHHLPVETVVGISTDKACKPVNVMGMTKAIQERLFVHANMEGGSTRYICVRYGNVLTSRGSVIPLFLDQIRRGGPVTITTSDMTRFLLSLDQAVDAIFTALRDAAAGETYVPNVPAAKVLDVAEALIGERKIATVVTGIRPGEKIHEILVSEEEANRTIARGRYFVVQPLLPELLRGPVEQPIGSEYSSAHNLMTREEVTELLRQHHLLGDREPGEEAVFE